MKFGQTLGQVELWSDVPPRMKLQVRFIFGQTLGHVELWSDAPTVRDILWPSVIPVWDRLAFGQKYPPG